VAFALSLYRPIGLNPRLRYYRYEPGERFPPHFDIAHEEGPEARTFLTFIVYLNEGYQGGETRFGDVAVAPRAGMALVFPHELRHEGAPITEGWKCVLRSDVMYRLERARDEPGAAPDPGGISVF
jgi:predicted 2-oxoglutarate/Fe(II)-dependent dioxygenase YbiX